MAESTPRVMKIVIAMRAHPGLLWDIETFVSSELGSLRAKTVWQAIGAHAALAADVTRAEVYEAALEFGMRLHPARAKALEDAA